MLPGFSPIMTAAVTTDRFVPAGQGCLWLGTLKKWAGNLGYFECLHEQSCFWGAAGRVRQHGLILLTYFSLSLSVSC